MTHCLCLVIGFVCATLAVLGDEPQAKQLLLAQNGRTDYRIVVPKNADELKDAANDLKETLKELTGADFSPDKDREKTRCIYIGIPSPNDQEPLAQNERRITTCDGDIYLYGNGCRANENTVYDFLRDVLGCRWYTVNGDRRIPRQETLALSELKRSRIPSIPFLTARRATGLSPWNSFARKIGLYEQTDLSIGQHIHAGQRIVPSGLVPFEGRRGNTFGPLKYFIDRKYFQEHPEYYSMDSKGRRVITMQLCYSNMAMRDEYVRNIIHMLEQENYQGGQFIVGVLPGGNLFIVRSYDPSRKPKWINAPVPRRLTENRLQRTGGLDGKYHYHYLGAMPIEHDMQVFFGPVSPSSGFAVGHLFDPGRPKRLFDFHVCIAADPDKRLVKVGELVVIPREDEATDDKANPKNRLDHAVDEFL